MRVGFWIPHIDSRPGGLGVYIREICVRLFARFPDHVLFTMSSSEVPLDWGVATTVKFDVTKSEDSRVRQAGRYFALNVLLPFSLKEHGCDVFFVPFHEGMLLSPVPQVVVIHDLTMLRHPSGYFSPLLAAYMRYVLPVVVENCEAVVCVSENTARDVEHFCGVSRQRLEVVTEGYDGAIYRPRSKRERVELLEGMRVPSRFLLYSGTMAPHKNVVFLADVLAEARGRGLDLGLVLTGRLDAGSFAPLKARLLERGVWEHTYCVGYVSDETLSALMQEAFAFVFPSLYEGFGLAPLEAMASGASVICSDRASLPEVVGDGGDLVSVDDLEGWVLALERRLDDDWDRQLRERAVRGARRFSWDDAVDCISGLLFQACGRRVSR